MNKMSIANKKKYAIAITLAFSMLCISAIILIYKLSQNQDIPKKQDLSNQGSFTPTPLPSPNPAWKIPQNFVLYENNEIGIKFEHPEQYPPVFDEVSKDSIYLYIPGPSQNPESDFYDGIAIEIKAGEIPPSGFNESVKELYNTLKEDINIKVTSQLKKTSLKGKKGYMFTTQEAQTNYTRMYFPLGKENKYINILYSISDPYSKGLSAITNRIINSIEF